MHGQYRKFNIIELCENVLNKKIHTHREVCVYLCNHGDEKKIKENQITLKYWLYIFGTTLF